MNQWEKNAKDVEMLYGCFVDWEERFYNCPWCGEPVYECDWTEEELKLCLCPVCQDIDAEEDNSVYEFEPGRFTVDMMALNP